MLLCAAGLGGEEYRKHGLAGLCSSGKNLADGAWAMSFGV